MEFEAFSSGDVPLDTSPCGICGRNFNSTALARHQPICAKSAQKSRKTFDSSKQRAEGTDINQTKKPRGRGAPAQKAAPPPPKNNWRAKHEDFINAIRSARGVQQAIDSGKPLPPPPPPSINPDYVQCEYCMRRFNQQAAERHVRFCKEQHSRLPTKKPDANETAKFNTRKQYKVPRPSLKSSPQSSTQNKRGLSSTATSARGGKSASRAVPVSNYNNNFDSPSQSSYSASRYSDYGTESPSSGRALRTGRTAESYTQARELSATQRSSMPRTKSTPTATGSRYGSNYGKKTPSSSSTTTAHGSGSSHGSGVRDNGYYSGDSDQVNAQYNNSRVGSGLSKFCHDCGSKYPITTAKFCCECGVRRVTTH